MRYKLLIAIILSLSTIVIAGKTAHANEQIPVLKLENTETSLTEIIKENPEPPKPVEYIVVAGDTLDSLSKAHTTTWERVWAKNSVLQHPDQLKPGEKLIIPQNDEVLAPRPVPTPVIPAPVAVTTGGPPVQKPSNGADVLTGRLGYARAGGNCVNEPGVNSPRLGPGTGPKDWAVLTKTPTIGATAVFKINHTGVVTGIWSNGDLEIRHQNYRGGKHRFSQSDFRGFR